MKCVFCASETEMYSVLYKVSMKREDYKAGNRTQELKVLLVRFELCQDQVSKGHISGRD